MVLMILLGAIGAAAGVAMIVGAVRDGSSIDLFSGLGLAVGGLFLGTWALVIGGGIRVIVSNERHVHEASARLGRIETLSELAHRDLRELSDLARLSDQTKSLLFRDREIEAFRETIHADLMRQDYKSASALIDSIESRFGYADEAARLRQEVEESRKRSLEEKIDAAIARIDEICQRNDWNQAQREAQRVMRLFPDNPRVAALPDRIRQAHGDRKRELLQEYAESVRKSDVDRGVELLRELDNYLAPQEAAALQESARGVLRAKLHNYGVQFAICVADQRWAEAITVGEQIMKEYPNSRMAQEVRERMDQLRQRAGLVNK
jgi:hypothetical protein